MRKKISEDKIETIINELPSLIEGFTEWWYGQGGGPSLYFYQKTINKVRNNNLKDLLDNTSFIELLYATLTAWDMDCQNAELKDFGEFKQNIQGNRESILELCDYKLDEISEEELDDVKNKLRELYNNLRLMRSSKNLVSNSKLLHFLVPDLVMPMDRAYVIKYFYGNKDVDSENHFIDIFNASWRIAQAVELDKFLDDDYNLSKPKVIDNAINAKMR